MYYGVAERTVRVLSELFLETPWAIAGTSSLETTRALAIIESRFLVKLRIIKANGQSKNAVVNE